jgi:hypothetical protein
MYRDVIIYKQPTNTSNCDDGYGNNFVQLLIALYSSTPRETKYRQRFVFTNVSSLGTVHFATR